MPVYCKYVAPGNVADYRPGADRATGQVQLFGRRVTIVSKAIDHSDKPLGTVSMEGIWDVPQVAGVIAAGTLVYWNPTGNPVGGTAGEGAFQAAATDNLAGVACPEQPNGTNATAATDQFVRIKLAGLSINVATVAGSMTADDITGSDGDLTIVGLAEGGADDTGGVVTVQGGTGADTKAGGLVTVLGGTGTGAANGGAVAVTGGTAGATSGTGGAITVTGGGPGAGANFTGGALTLAGGVAKGTGTGGAVAIASGASAGADGTAGNVAIDCGADTGGTAGTIAIAATNAASVTFGKMPRIPTATVNAAGADNTDATAVTEGFTLVDQADAAKGVILPSAVAGMQVIIKNKEAAVLKVYPNADDKINGGTHTTGSLDIAASTAVLLIAYDATNWYSLPLLPS